MRLILSLAAAVLTAAVAVPADNWPEFRGPTGDGISAATGVPTEWSEDRNVRWKTAVHGKGWSSPVVWGDQVWVTTADEIPRAKKVPAPRTAENMIGNAEQVTFFAVCVDRKTGTVTHDIKLAVEKDPAFCIETNSYASPTPVVEEGRVYAHFGSHGTWCVDTATGKVVWERRDLKCNHFRGPASSPILYKNLLVLILDGFDQQYVAALDKATGATVWRRDREIKYTTENGDLKKAYATARVIDVNGKPQLVCPSAECTIAYDPLTGDELWRFHHLKRQTMNVAARPVAGHGLIYLVSGNPSQLMALKQGGSGLLSRNAVAWETDKGVPSQPSLLLVGDLLFMVSDAGIMTCLDAKSGKVHWSERVLGDTSASPVLAGGNIYAADRGGKTSVVRAVKEFEPVATNVLDAGCMASPAVSGGALILRTKTHVYSIGAK